VQQTIEFLLLCDLLYIQNLKWKANNSTKLENFEIKPNKNGIKSLATLKWIIFRKILLNIAKKWHSKYLFNNYLVFQ